jgi:tryptophanyl-tRNA synthetase
MKKKGYVVTPWEVSGDIDYGKLIKEFGVSKINEDTLDRIQHFTKDLHFMLRRKIFFCA